ncbi:FAD-dependent monooxygenase [Nocardia terpenica]|uniref:FAD-dependent oxidoreductase n=1 Tax=Nocardia terpenica TaxID=455432 RepID=A0A164KFS4_9NOCA|nr:FAD-dependent monooxygenase [Nocardia terpenica]KZM71351.1 FAD-dependent oxidoreductase [Nocardia terpenica]NQE90498.1 FAD-dependent oxidoreductase [Nocardia terpenica]
MRDQTVLISGASVAGPALAYWLRRYGYAVTVVERASALRAGGQAIDFKGRTQRTVVERMGMWEEIGERQTGRTDMVFVDADGNRRAELSGEFLGGDVEILRGDLAEIFHGHTAADCEYLFGDSITALTDTGHGVHVEFEHAPARTFDLVFGCDGIHSAVRRLAFGPERDYVDHLGYYYCVAGAPGWGHDPARRTRNTALAWHAPGRLAIEGGSKASQMYMFASPELDLDRHDIAAQRRLVAEKFVPLGGRFADMVAELDALPDFYLDSLSRVRMKGRCTTGRVALVGDAGYGNTLGGLGTGLAVVGAYVLAGELAAADGEHTVAFARYDEIMRRYAKLADNASAGRFLAPRTGWGVRLRNWFVESRAFGLMLKMTDDATNDIDLRDYPSELGYPASDRGSRELLEG